ncbi:MAG: DUF4190 domain-containing protein [Verrucomicrobiae bacterium]|nr:DUF4190 domain-containing protein [Verrucomicrobiae bacterium]
MNYTIIGNDGKSYGPIGADQLRQWIKQSRVESRTPVFVQGSTDWTFLGLLPEFAAEFPDTTPPTITPPKSGFAAGAPAVPAAPARNSSLAVWGFVCGLLGWTFCGCCVPFDILGLTFSIIALVQINARTEPLAGRGFAIAGLVLSATNLAWSLALTLLGLLNNPSQFQTHFGNFGN